GGICVSMDVERQIRNALEARFEKFGSADLKNIKLPMDLFRIVLPWEQKPEVKSQRSEVRRNLSNTKWVGIAALAVLAIGTGWWWMERSSKNQQSAAAHAVPATSTKAPDQKSVAVLPFV